MQGTKTGISFSQVLRRHWLVLVVGYVFLYADPFTVNSKTSQAISDAFDRIFSCVYSSDYAGRNGSESADLVDVILIDDFSISTLSNQEYGYLRANDWPLAYSDHGILIDALRRLGYGTVILDITFYRARQRDESFQSLVNRLSYFRDQAGMAVILSAGENPAEELEESITPLTRAVSGLGLVGWSGYGRDYPVNLVLKKDEQDVPTLAVAGYEAYCRKTRWPGCRDLSEADNAWFVPKVSGMHMSWGMPAQRMASSLNCVAPVPDAPWYERLRYWLRYQVGAGSGGSEGRQDCPPLPTATLRDVFCAGEECDPFFSTGEANGERIAIVGVSLPAVRDLFDPPIPGSLPGVYLHAEAIRNLLYYGPGYLKPLGLQFNLAGIGLPAYTISLDLILFWPLLLWAALFPARWLLYWQWGSGGPSERSELATEIGEVVTILILLCLVYTVALLVQRTPGFLTELIGITPLLLIAIRNERKEMENERQILALAACAAVQLAAGRNPGH